MQSNDRSLPLGEVFGLLKQEDPEWLELVLRERWEQVRASQEASTVVSSSRAPTRLPSLGTHDLTAFPLGSGATPRLTDHVRKFRAHDWSTTSLGPMETWPMDLRRMVNLCMADPRAVAIWWGPKRIVIFNEAYDVILAGRGNWAMGRPFAEVWPELVDSSFGQAFTRADVTGSPSFGDDECFYVQRHGMLQEVWASWALIPIPGPNDNICYYNAFTETTRRVVYDRRMATLQTLERETADAATVDSYWKKVISGLGPNEVDVPFAAIFSAPSTDNNTTPRNRRLQDTDANNATEASSNASSRGNQIRWVLQGVIQNAHDRCHLPARINADSELEIFGPLLNSASRTMQPQVLRAEDETLPTAVLGKITSRAHGEACRAAVLFPIGRGHPSHRGGGFLLLALNTRHSYDADYQQFVSMLARQLSTSFATVLMVEDEARHARISAELAARDRVSLTEKLAVTEYEARENELRFRRMTDHSPIAMYEVNVNGELLYANQVWADLTEQSPWDTTPMCWINAIHEGDREVFQTYWVRLLAGETLEFELRLAKAFVADDLLQDQRVEGETWILAAAYPEFAADGSVKNVLGCLVDISRQKWMEGFQQRRTTEALESKRQQERFMDMTSHEARNPLAAIMLCVESILQTLKDVLVQPGDLVTISRDTLDSTVDSAEIIMSCCQHQKRIIDDVLMVSKLDSGLLAIAPVEVNAEEEIERVMKMFDGELHQNDIDIRFVVNQTYRDLRVEWVLLDPARLSQILINLITNAMKFTKHESTRRITVALDASISRPEASCDGVRFLERADKPTKPVSSVQDDVYLSISVRDTGRGIEESDLACLFQRFQQASPKTHVRYGGSGLGLFISRQLARLQGGEIGVASNYGSGSTFAFFIKSSKCPAPQTSTLRLPSRPSPGVTRSSNSIPLAMSQLRGGLNEVEPKMSSSTAPSEMQVLLVEDNLVNQKVMSKQLKRAHFHVQVANHGQEALEFLQKTTFYSDEGAVLDIVLMDIEMPIMNGLTCTREIRQLENSGRISSHVPIIGVTANARVEQQNLAIEAGMDAVVTKPFRMDDLLKELDNMKQLYG